VGNVVTEKQDWYEDCPWCMPGGNIGRVKQSEAVTFPIFSGGGFGERGWKSTAYVHRACWDRKNAEIQAGKVHG
jgi:hypothetical protein